MNKKHNFLIIIFSIIIFFNLPFVVNAQADVIIPGLDLQFGTSDNTEDVATTLQLLLLLTVLSLAPAILILMTSFTRIIIVLSFIRNALATQQMPPNQVLIGLALFLTFFVMQPVFVEVNENALKPYFNEEISQQEAIDESVKPFKDFMIKQTREKDLLLFLNYAQIEEPDNVDDIPITVLVPAFAISELKTAFQMGFMIYLPFLVIDMVVSSTLMAMGMMMLPPSMISLPFKILLFVMVDGWYLVVKSLLESFN
ncbi:MAG: flagellar type III secretion system pore protein FliP [Vulcanibacillus sp.]